jgi:hypothetical protein
VRLLVDRQGRVAQGELGYVEDDHDIARWVAFRGPEGLLGAVHAVLAGAPDHPG